MHLQSIWIHMAKVGDKIENHVRLCSVLAQSCPSLITPKIWWESYLKNLLKFPPLEQNLAAKVQIYSWALHHSGGCEVSGYHETRLTLGKVKDDFHLSFVESLCLVILRFKYVAIIWLKLIAVSPNQEKYQFPPFLQTFV